MHRLYRAADLPEAHLILGMLAAAGIEARLGNQHARGGMGEIPFTETYPEIWVTEHTDLARARGIVQAYEHPAGPAKVRRCRACGEDNPGGFEICWQCATALE